MVLRRDRRSGGSVRHVPTVNLDEVTGYAALWLHLATLTHLNLDFVVLHVVYGGRGGPEPRARPALRRRHRREELSPLL